MTAEQIGERFSRTSLDHGPAAPDSQRLRKRLSAHFYNKGGKISDRLAYAIGTELGVHVPLADDWPYWPGFIQECEVRDLLDFITLSWRLYSEIQGEQVASEWLAFVRRAMLEENLSYRVDDAGGVRFAVDSEFARAQAAAIASLADARYAAVRHAVEECNKALDLTQPDTLKAVRSQFDAQETLFKQMFPQVARLGSTEIDRFIVPALPTLYAGRELEATKLYVSSWKKWTDALHQYRHADRAEEPSPPPTDLAVTLVSAGMGHLRWLVTVAEKLRSAK